MQELQIALINLLATGCWLQVTSYRVLATYMQELQIALINLLATGY